jgi:hypothetical protein
MVACSMISSYSTIPSPLSCAHEKTSHGIQEQVFYYFYCSDISRAFQIAETNLGRTQTIYTSRTSLCEYDILLPEAFLMWGEMLR